MAALGYPTDAARLSATLAAILAHPDDRAVVADEEGRLLGPVVTARPGSSPTSRATHCSGRSPGSSLPPGSSHSSRSFRSRATSSPRITTPLTETGNRGATVRSYRPDDAPRWRDGTPLRAQGRPELATLSPAGNLRAGCGHYPSMGEEARGDGGRRG